MTVIPPQDSHRDLRKDQRKLVGAAGEALAEAYLRSLGYCILERNWRCRTGEIDIVAEIEGILVFVEVRSRSVHGKFGLAKESVNVRKQLQVRETAQYYLHRYRLYDKPLRFDVISVHFTKEGEDPLLEQIKGAF
jgi:putative endonuclease